MLGAVEFTPSAGNPVNDWHPKYPVLNSPTHLPSSCRLIPMASFMKSFHLILGIPLFLFPSIFPGSLSFSKTSASHVPKVGQVSFFFSFFFSFFASSDVSGLICFRTHLFVFLATQDIQRTLLQHNNSNEPS